MGSIVDALNAKNGTHGMTIVDCLNEKNGTKAMTIAEAIEQAGGNSGSGIVTVLVDANKGTSSNCFLPNEFFSSEEELAAYVKEALDKDSLEMQVLTNKGEVFTDKEITTRGDGEREVKFSNDEGDEGYIIYCDATNPHVGHFIY